MLIRVRFPNESQFELIDIDPNVFIRTQIIGDNVFGYYKSTYICIPLEDYDKLKEVTK